MGDSDKGLGVDACWASANSPLLRIKGLNSVPVSIVGPVLSFWMHWQPELSRTIPCVKVRCQSCVEFVPRRPLSYVAVLNEQQSAQGVRWYPRVLEVPLSAGIALSELRGRCLGLRRIKKFGPVQIGTYSPKQAPPPCRAWDIVPGLCRLWRIPGDTALSLVSSDQWQMLNVQHG